MGKTSKPLSILVEHSLGKTKEIEDLKEKGHNIVTVQEHQYDLVLGPHCWRMTHELLPYLETAIKRARVERYGGKDDS